jgi:hypothetical protein
MNYCPRTYACIVLLTFWPTIHSLDDISFYTSKRPSNHAWERT